MRILMAIVVSALLAGALGAGDEVTKDGKLTQRLKITQLQGGFAGFTGVEYLIEPDGAWATSSVFNRKTTPKEKGKLGDKELQALVNILVKNEFQKLPAKSGKQPGANPHTITIEYGKLKATFVGQTAPRVDAQNDMSVESRFAAIMKGVTGSLKTTDKKID